jgi:DtxR family Mn-dependent transcriptional regulator
MKTQEKRVQLPAAIEDYLKTIYILAQEESPVTTSKVAEAREIKPSSVTSMVQRMEKMGYVHYQKHRGVTLTNAGKKIALEMIRHHRIIELYLTQELGFGWEEVHEQAEVLEHVISEELEARMAAVLGNPTRDPHGEPIPTLDGEIQTLSTIPLRALKNGQTGQVIRIGDDTNSELLRYLAEIGIVPDTLITLKKIDPFDGPLTVIIDNAEHIVGHKVAGLVHITLQEA